MRAGYPISRPEEVKERNLEIYYDDRDRVAFLEIIGEMAGRYAVEVFAYVQSMMNKGGRLQGGKKIFIDCTSFADEGQESFADCHIGERGELIPSADILKKHRAVDV